MLKNVSQKDLRLSVTFSAPGAGGVTIFVAKGPQQNDGSFLTANLADVGVLTADQIAAGVWTEQSPLAPGRYWVMVGANPDYTTCQLDDGTISPTCSSGDSNVDSVTVAPPVTRYLGSVVSKRAGSGAISLRLTATPLGVPEAVKLCYRITVRKRQLKRCLNRHLSGVDWSKPVDDVVRLSTTGMSKHESFTWTLAGRTVARLTAAIP